MATRNENLIRVGSAMQMGGMLAQMVDANTTGLDDRAGKIVQQVGAGFVKAGSGNLKSGADILDAAGDALKALAEEMRGG